MDHKLSMNALIFALTLGAVVCFGAFVLYSTWIEKYDGRRQKQGERGLETTADRSGNLPACDEDADDS